MWFGHNYHSENIVVNNWHLIDSLCFYTHRYTQRDRQRNSDRERTTHYKESHNENPRHQRPSQNHCSKWHTNTHSHSQRQRDNQTHIQQVREKDSEKLRHRQGDWQNKRLRDTHTEIERDRNTQHLLIYSVGLNILYIPVAQRSLNIRCDEIWRLRVQILCRTILNYI